jgi:ribonuclease HII
MVKMEAEHPGYGFAEHKGYSTPVHMAALEERGPCSEHRYSFANVRRVAGSGATAPRLDGSAVWGMMETNLDEGQQSR